MGDCIATSAGKLPFKKIVHAVGPTWPGGKEEQFQAQKKLKSAIFNSLATTSAFNYHSIAFPAISSGVFRFPKDVCAKCFFDMIQKYASDEQQRKEDGAHV